MPGRRAAVGRIYEDPARPFEREVYVSTASLVRGHGIVGTPTGRFVEFRGQQVEVLYESTGRDHIVSVIEGSADQPCSQFTARGVGLTFQEFERMVASITWTE